MPVVLTPRQPAASDWTYRFFNIKTGAPIADLPIAGQVQFGQQVNAPGQATGLPIALYDSRVMAQPVFTATDPWLTMMGVLYKGNLAWGGIVAKRSYQRSRKTITIDVVETSAWLKRRLQAADYSTTWSTTAAGSMAVVAQIIADAQAVDQILGGLTVVPTNYLGNGGVSGSSTTQEPTSSWINPTYPITQLQTLDSIVSTLASQGYLIGFDYAIDLSLDVNGNLFGVLNLSYPRRGRVAGQSGLKLDVASLTDFQYDEDGTNQADRVVATASGSGGLQADQSAPSVTSAGYPRLEVTSSYSQVNAQGVLDNLALSELAAYGYGVVTAVATYQLDNSGVNPVPGSWLVGDDFNIVVPKTQTTTTSPDAFSDPRFPNGLNINLRLASWTCSIPAGGGKATIVQNFVMPPSTVPYPPPIR